MKVTPKHLAYASVLAVGALALLLDSAFPPASAAAAISSPAAESTAAALAGAASAYSTPLDTGLAPLADRLAQLNQRHIQPDSTSRDAFSVDTVAWGIAKAPEPDRTPVSVDTNLVLTAIMANQGVGVAVINGGLARVGDRVGGYVVVSIRPRSVVLDLDGHTVTLAVQPNGAP